MNHKWELDCSQIQAPKRRQTPTLTHTCNPCTRLQYPHKAVSCLYLSRGDGQRKVPASVSLFHQQHCHFEKTFCFLLTSLTTMGFSHFYSHQLCWRRLCFKSVFLRGGALFMCICLDRHNSKCCEQIWITFGVYLRCDTRTTWLHFDDDRSPDSRSGQIFKYGHTKKDVCIMVHEGGNVWIYKINAQTMEGRNNRSDCRYSVFSKCANLY